MKTMFDRAAALGLLALLGSGAGAWALPGDDKEKDDRKVVEKRRIVMVGPDGKERVIEGDAPLFRRGYLGVGLTEMTAQLRTHFGAPEDAGVMVSEIEAGSPAEKAGLKVGDIIAEVDGHKVRSSWDLRARLRTSEEGQQVPLEVWRDGRVQTLTAAIALRERPEMDMGPLFIREDGEEGPVVIRLNREMEGLPERIELPRSGEGVRPFWNERSPRELLLEKRLQELEKRIQEMERQLEKKGN